MSEENKRSLGTLEELTSSDFVDHADKEVRGPAEGLRRFHEAYNKEAFPDADDVTVEERLPLR